MLVQLLSSCHYSRYGYIIAAKEIALWNAFQPDTATSASHAYHVTFHATIDCVELFVRERAARHGAQILVARSPRRWEAFQSAVYVQRRIDTPLAIAPYS